MDLPCPAQEQHDASGGRACHGGADRALIVRHHRCLTMSAFVLACLQDALLEICSGIVAALAHLHAKGIVHGGVVRDSPCLHFQLSVWQ